MSPVSVEISPCFALLAEGKGSNLCTTSFTAPPRGTGYVAHSPSLIEQVPVGHDQRDHIQLVADSDESAHTVRSQDSNPPRRYAVSFLGGDPPSALAGCGDAGFPYRRCHLLVPVVAVPTTAELFLD